MIYVLKMLRKKMRNINKELIIEQNDVIQSEYKKIIVSAGPGSGKTYTLIKKIIQDYNQGKKFIALSFTKEASKQLKDKLNNEILDVEEENYIGTIDSFVINLINKFYSLVENIPVKKKEIKYLPKEFDKERKIINYSEQNGEVIQYYKNWVRNFTQKDEIYMSFCIYIYCRKILNNEYVKDYLKYKYNKIYIDEAQDLNYWQYTLFNKIIDQSDYEALFVGDEKQCIYQFRGARPDLFQKLEQNGYKKYEIKNTVRCPENILKFSYLYQEQEQEKIDNFDEIEFNKEVSLNHRSDETAMFLASLSKECLEIYDKLLYKGFTNVKYVMRPLIKFIDEDIDQLIELCIMFIINKEISKNKKENATVLKKILDDLNTLSEKKWEHLYDSNMENYNEILEKIFKEKIYIDEIMNNEHYYYYYDLKPDFIKIMTIHASKGLEADHVYVRINSDISSTKIEVRNRYFVAFTRSKKKLYISGGRKDIEYLQQICC